MYHTRFAGLLALLLLVLAACASAPPSPSIPPLDVAALAALRTPLAEALVASEQIPDVRTRVFVYSRIAQGYVETGDPESALKVLDRTIATVNAHDIGADIPDVLADVADTYVRAGATDKAPAILARALEDAQKISDPYNRGVVLERIVNTCIDAGPSAYDILRQTLQSIYIIEDLWTRATILTETARRYQAQSSTPTQASSVDVLLQQAIPAAGSIANPWLKALALSEIAMRFNAAGNHDSASYYASRAYDEITSVQVLRRSEEDAAHVVAVAGNLARLGMSSQSVRVLATVEYPYLRAEGLADIALVVNGFGSSGQALQLCSQAIDLAESDPTIYRRGEALGAIALVYGQLEQTRLALATAQVALELMPSVTDTGQRASIVQPVAEVQLRWGAGDEASATLDMITDIYSRASTMVSIGERLVAAHLPVQASKLVAAAAALVPQAPYLRQNLYRGVADVMIHLGEFPDALAQVAKISDPYTLAIALADLQSALSIPTASGSLSEADHVVLGEIGNRLLASSGPTGGNGEAVGAGSVSGSGGAARAEGSAGGGTTGGGNSTSPAGSSGSPSGTDSTGATPGPYDGESGL